MTDKLFVDGALVEHGGALFNSSPVRPVKPAKSISTGLVPTRKRTAGQGGAPGQVQQKDAKTIRSKLGSVTRRTPQVMVKISGGGKGMKQIAAHIDYISRNGKLDVEDQDGAKLTGRDELRDLKDEWRYGSIEIPDDGNRREAFNIVLSMPRGTDSVGLLRAARDFAAAEFEGHQYAMALHTPENDPHRPPAKNPHVHLIVKAQSLDGDRLNPRKADLQRWRERFAEALKDRGIDAAATRRQTRLHRTRGLGLPAHHAKNRGVELTKVGKPVAHQHVQKAQRTQEKVLGSYRRLAKVLATSDDPADRKLGVDIVNHLAANPALQRNGPRSQSRSDDER